jgi:drug/metabolite transporter (DMT)-like permease
MSDTEDASTTSPVLALALLSALIFWAGAFAAIKLGLDGGYSPQSLALLRFLVASAAMGVAALFVRIPLPNRKSLPLLVLASLCGIPIYHISLNYAEVTFGAGPAALFINVSPVMAALLAVAVLRERLGWLGWAGTAVSFAGAVVIAVSKGGHLDPRAAFVLLAAGAGAVYTVAQKPVLKNMSPIAFTAWAVWIGTACLLPMLPRFLHEVRTARTSATLAGAYMGVFPTALSYAMWAKVISKMNVSRAVSFLYLVPAFAVVIAWLLLGEVPAPVALFGGILVIAGVVLVNSRTPTRVVESSPVVTSAEASGG